MASLTIQRTDSECYNPNNEYTCILLLVDGQEAGFINLDIQGDEAQIAGVAIFKNHKGKGYYRQFLTAVLSELKLFQLVSTQRNENSNPCYEKWCGQNLNEDQVVNIRLNFDDELEFVVE